MKATTAKIRLRLTNAYRDLKQVAEMAEALREEAADKGQKKRAKKLAWLARGAEQAMFDVAALERTRQS